MDTQRITVKTGNMVAHKILDKLLDLAEDFELTADVNVEIDLSVLVTVNSPKPSEA
jgi:hypothetical protein